MTIEEYLKIRVDLFNLPESEKKFLKDICRSVGHEWFKDPNEFADVCTRCEEKVGWDKLYSDSEALKKIGQAMASPLKANLDYKGIVGR